MFLRELPSAWKNGLIFAGLALTIWLLYSIAEVIAPFLVSIIIAYILNPVVRFLERLKIPRPYAVLLLGTGMAITMVIVVVPVSLKMLSEGQDLAVKFSSIEVTRFSETYRTQARDLVASFSANPLIGNYLQETMNSEKVSELIAKGVIILKDMVVRLLQHIAGFFFKAFSGVLGLLVIPLLTFYLLVDFDLFCGNALLLIPPMYRDSCSRVFGKLDLALSSFLRGQIIANLLFGSLMTIGLWLIGLNYALFLGPLAGVANLIPYLGGFSTAIIASLVALFQFGMNHGFLYMLLKIGLILAIIQGIDGFILQPRIIGENVGLHPLIIMFAFVIGGSVFGFLGMLLAIPVTCILRVLSRELYEELYDET
jgi:predicted PurR-regulated permease PerM